LSFVSSRLAELDEALELGGASAVVIDLDATREQEVISLLRLMTRIGSEPPVLAITQSADEAFSRMLLRMGVAGSLAKPVTAADFKSACTRVIEDSANHESRGDAQVYTFLPVVGGAGVTTLAVQTAMLLLNSSHSRNRSPTCLVDLDFQNGAVADYLDIEPRLALGEIVPRPERLDRQMLEIMISKHASGLAVVAAPHRATEMDSVPHDVVTRLLDLVSGHFENIVIDMPRGWFSWTDDVLLGSNRLFIVSRMTVPTLRRAKQMVAAIEQRCPDGPKPKVVINGFEQRLFSTSLRRSDLEQILGEALLGTIPDNQALVRESIDRGVPLDEIKPNNDITRALKALVLPEGSKPRSAGQFAALKNKLQLSAAGESVLRRTVAP
jgi:pilus assembly protein CpaE